MLKKIAAILLLSVLLFNWVGYRLLTAYWQERAAAQLDARLGDDRYDPSQLILLRISAESLPYSNSSRQFERYNGIIQIGATRYLAVKKRMYNDSLEFLCIADNAANRLTTAKNEFFRLVNDLQRSGHPKIPGAPGKSIPAVNKIVWCNTQHFLRLRHLTARPLPSPRYLRTELFPGYPRIVLQPPRHVNTLS